KQKAQSKDWAFCFCVICCLPMSFFAAQGKSNWHRYEHCAATVRREGQDVRHHCSPSEQRPALRPGLWCLLVLNPESEKFADSDGRLIASGLWQQQRLRKLANYRQEEPE
ncbi:hypothetical protein ACYBYX_12065, partial [Klebsiella pneumoniae]